MTLEKSWANLATFFHHQRGSHRYYFKGARIIGVPVHKGRTLGKGLANKIITKDMGITVEDFFNLL